jgi:hypothetical protein
VGSFESDRLGYFFKAIVAPPELRVCHVTLMAIGETKEVVSRMEQSVDLVFRGVFGHPVALVLTKVEHL